MLDALLTCEVWQVLSFPCAEKQHTAIKPDSTAPTSQTEQQLHCWSFTVSSSVEQIKG